MARSQLLMIGAEAAGFCFNSWRSADYLKQTAAHTSPKFSEALSQGCQICFAYLRNSG